QEQALRTRMQRIGSAWKSLPRAVRDVSKTSGKKARLEMVGEGIELDRTIIEAVRDPMLHLVRNSVDHGLETPEDRKKAGKDETGTIRLSAVQDGGHVVVEVSDDGGGIDPEKICAAAISKGVITRDAASKLSDREKTELILAPGFSTAAAVTKISGRGVGMDVVASNIRDIRGSLEIKSELGVGTTIRLSIPLTLAIVPALMVTSADDLFAIPQASVIELVRLREGDDSERKIEYVHEAPVLRLREKLLPLIDIADILKTERPERQAATVVVLQSSDRPFGLVVDQVSKAEEIVVKPVSESVQALGCYAGATVLGDGSAALILDVSALAGTANMAAGSGSTLVSDNAATSMEQPTPVLTVLVGDRSAALPTEQLERLEKIDPASIEWSGRTPVVQYRGRLLPLVDLGSMLHHMPADQGTGPLRVVVTNEEGDSSVGLIVDQVLDVVDVDLATVDRVGADARMGVYGSVVAAGTVVDLVDVDQIANTIDNGPAALIGESAA
ncbi:MAG: chemotaxis protein CheA, partial [Actinomycetota bacterium]